MPKASFLVFCSAFFTLSFGVAAMAPLIPSIAAYFKVSREDALPLTWLYMLPYGFFALLWAPLTRVFTVKKILLFATLGFFLSTFFLSLAQTIRQAFIFRFLMGCFGCSFVPLVLITIGKTVAGNDKPKYLGTFFALAYLSTLLSVFLTGFLSWRIIYLIPAVLSLGVFSLIPRYLSSFDFRKESFKLSYLETFKDRRAVSFFIVIILGSFLYHSLYQRFGVYLKETYALPQFTISLIFTVATLCGVIFQLGGGYLSSRLGEIKVARAGFILMSVFIFLLLAIKRYEFIFFAVIFWGSGWAIAHVGLSTYLTRFPDKILRDASSLNSALRFGAGGLGAFAGSFLVALAGYRLFFAAIGLATLLLGVYLVKITPQRKESYG